MATVVCRRVSGWPQYASYRLAPTLGLPQTRLANVEELIEWVGDCVLGDLRTLFFLLTLSCTVAGLHILPSELLFPGPTFRPNHGKSGMTQLKNAFFAGLVITAVSVTSVRADPFADARDALNRRDTPAAIQIMKPLADRGDPRSQVFLGLLYYEAGTSGATRNDSEAATWFRKAAEQGSADGQSMLATMYLAGRGVPPSYTEAAKWFRKAADQGLSYAQLQLAIIYDGQYGKDTGVPTDNAQALDWYMRAAVQGEPVAQDQVGVKYLNGTGVPKNAKIAVKWFCKAASGGSAHSMVRLCGLYNRGVGVSRNYRKSIAWCRASAEQGDANGQAALGTMYLLGRGVPRDDLQAYVWLNLAAAHRDATIEARKMRDIAARELKRDQIAKAERLSRKWKPKKAAEIMAQLPRSCP